MSLTEVFAAAFMIVGAGFFLAGTIGLLRFPDVYSRLHALAKVDNLGLGFTLLGLVLQAGQLADAIKLLAIWLLVLAASAAVGFLIGRRSRLRGLAAWRAPGE